MLNKLVVMFMFFLCFNIGDVCVADFPIMYDLNDAVALSESTGQSVVLIFGATWCPYCVELKKDINDGNFGRELDNKIVCYIDVDKHKDLKKEYDVRTLPDTRYLVDKKEKSQIKGYNEPKFKVWLKNAEQK